MWRNWNPINPPVNDQSSDDETNNYQSAEEADPHNLVNQPQPTPAENSENIVNTREVLEQAVQRLNMPDPPIVNYDMSTGEDTGDALSKAVHSLKGFEWNVNDLDFYFNQIET